jgi:hypothetical protein
MEPTAQDVADNARKGGEHAHESSRDRSTSENSVFDIALEAVSEENLFDGGTAKTPDFPHFYGGSSILEGASQLDDFAPPPLDRKADVVAKPVLGGAKKRWMQLSTHVQSRNGSTKSLSEFVRRHNRRKNMLKKACVEHKVKSIRMEPLTKDLKRHSATAVKYVINRQKALHKKTVERSRSFIDTNVPLSMRIMASQSKLRLFQEFHRNPQITLPRALKCHMNKAELYEVELEDTAYLGHIKAACASGYGKKVPKSFRKSLRRKRNEAGRSRRRRNRETGYQRGRYAPSFLGGLKEMRSALELANSPLLNASAHEAKGCTGPPLSLGSKSSMSGPSMLAGSAYLVHANDSGSLVNSEPSIFHHDRRAVISASKHRKGPKVGESHSIKFDEEHAQKFNHRDYNLFSDLLFDGNGATEVSGIRPSSAYSASANRFRATGGLVPGRSGLAKRQGLLGGRKRRTKSRVVKSEHQALKEKNAANVRQRPYSAMPRSSARARQLASLRTSNNYILRQTMPFTGAVLPGKDTRPLSAKYVEDLERKNTVVL